MFLYISFLSVSKCFFLIISIKFESIDSIFSISPSKYCIRCFVSRLLLCENCIEKVFTNVLIFSHFNWLSEILLISSAFSCINSLSFVT